MGVISEGVHSFLDLISAAVGFFTIRVAVKPADDDHPFGHGKIETISSLFESLLLVAAAILISLEGWQKLENPTPIQHEGLAMATIFGSMVISWWIYRHNIQAAEITDSSAIRVNALHFLADVVASVGVLIGLIAIRLTGWHVIDPLLAFGIAAYILFISFKQVKGALLELSDTMLPESEIAAIRRVMESFEDRIIEAHDLRTRKSGAMRHIDFHLVVCGQSSVSESHRICDEMEDQISSQLPGASINIHVEPCEHENIKCKETCPFAQERAKR